MHFYSTRPNTLKVSLINGTSNPSAEDQVRGQSVRNSEAELLRINFDRDTVACSVTVML